MPANSPHSTHSFHVRVAKEGDTERIINIVNAAFAVETFLEGTRTDEQRMAAMMLKGKFLVAEDTAGKIIAVVYTELRGNRGYFGMLAVNPMQQGTGIGRVMVEAAENHFRRQGATGVDIVVLNLRTELLPFYRKLGYIETSTEEFRPARPLKAGVECHSILMSKNF